ncbi:hypothetical protein [Zobellella endophytica]|uniref:hypothetical protein n=1 Tax=Zobellella endophytica TaxID=2116700 RepID=UPI0011B20CC2|nr:hypothetical protein [Zobellella endophytica]
MGYNIQCIGVKKIFGKNFKFEVNDTWVTELKETLLLYDDSLDNNIDVLIEVTTNESFYFVRSNNPKSYKRSDDGFQADFGHVKVSWSNIDKKPLKVSLHIKDKRPLPLIGFLKKLYSMEYPTTVEWFEQILHELVLVPCVYFLPDLAVVHAASISKNNECVLLTGTGGVGKSSALLSFIGDESISFISDDIVIVDSLGSVYSNFSWPKVYGYNCDGNALKEKILTGRGCLDRIHFYIKNKIDSSKVRRKIRPDKIFSSYLKTSCKLRGVYFLIREDVDSIKLSTLERNSSIKMACNVMNAEYQVFHKFIEWEEYNAAALGVSPLISMENVISKWKKVMNGSFPILINKVSIPIDIENVEYQEKIKKIIYNDFDFC